MKDGIKGLKSYFSTIDARLFQHLSGKPKEFVEIFLSKIFLTEEAFEQAVRGDIKDEYYYKDLKSRTLQILQAFVVVSPTKGASSLKKKLENCQKKFLVSHKFLTKGDREEGFRLAKQAYLEAEEYGFTHLACELATMLQHEYIYFQKNRREAAKYAAKARLHLQDYLAEKEAEICFNEVVEQLHYSTITIDKIEDIINKISSIESQSAKYKVYATFLKVLYGLQREEYKYIITNCRLVLHFFKSHKGIYPTQYFFFLQNQGMAQIALSQYAQAAASFEQAKQYTNNKPHNIYTIQFYTMLNALHARNYALAYELYQKNKKCKIAHIRQHFAIAEAYLCFLTYTGHLQLQRSFRMSKYLNETFKAQQEKQGNNINILIAELLVYLARDRGKLIDRIEGIKHYIYRHLKGEDTQRARWFLKIICTLPSVDFHPILLQRKCKKQISLLGNSTIRMGANLAIEFIPLDYLLALVLQQLQQKVA